MDMQNQENNSEEAAARRKARYRELLDKAEAMQERDNAGIQTVAEIGDIIQEANNLDSEIDIKKRVGDADETLLDCLVLSSASGVLKKSIESVDVYTATYDSTEFSGKIISEIKKEESEEMQPEDILKLLSHARKIIPSVPQNNSVYGSYDLNSLPVPKEKKQKQKVVKEKLQKKEPEKVVNAVREEEGIEEIVKVFYDVLQDAYIKNQKSPIGYYDYIIDTESYSKTIENMFHFSFLVRDGKAFLDLDGNGIPVIKPMSKRELKKFRDEGGKNSQVISCISMDIWENYKKEGLLQKQKNI